MTDSDSIYTLVPSLRMGLGARLQAVDDGGLGTGEVKMSLEVGVEGGSGAQSVTLSYRGPGDVAGVDSAQVVRVEPVNNARSVEPNYFPFIEFARADFPWLFTPARANSDGLLRPWVVLIVLPEGSYEFTQGSQGISFVTVSEPGVQLPSLAGSESAYWAHLQVSGSTGGDLEQVLKTQPEKVVSRLLCPRDLEANTAYRACLVPAFRSGREAGLGQDVSAADSLEPAWQSDDSSVQLPVYYSWRFTTGEDGDFESLVKRLEPRTMPASVGRRPLDATAPGLGLPAANAESLLYTGVLKAPAELPDEWDGLVPTEEFLTDVHALLNRAGGYHMDDEVDPVIAPPIYGRWQAGVESVDADAVAWVREMNEDPTQRVVGGIGTRVVQNEQESLLAAAWGQIGEVREANKILNRAMFAREVSQALIQKHVDPLSDAATIQLLAPAHGRSVQEGQTLKATLADTSLPRGMASAAFHRVTRAGGHAGRLAHAQGSAAEFCAAKLFERFDRARLADEGLTVAGMLGAELPVHPDGMVAIPDVKQVHVRKELEMIGGLRYAELEELIDKVRNPPLGFDPPQDLLRFLESLRETWLLFKEFDVDRRADADPAPDLAELATRLQASLDPDAALVARMRQRISGREELWSRGESLGPIYYSPAFEVPMYRYFRDLAEDWFTPGLEHVVDETITLLETHGPTIESYMVGLSHEMGRELLWREYSTDQRGTHFHLFWAPSTDVAGSGDHKGIESIHTWGGDLGSHLVTFEDDDSGESLVLLIRGELLRRYPDAIVYATNGTDPDADGFEATFPKFTGTLGNDITFFGFGFTAEEALSGTYWFVLEQQPTAPRYGLDEEGEVGTDWSNASWEWARAADQVSGNHIEIGTFTKSIASVEWGRNSADMAFITLQRPVRVYIPAQEMLESHA